MNKQIFFTLTILFAITSFLIHPMFGKCQGKPKVFFEGSDSLRVESSRILLPEVTLTIVIPKDKDSANLRDIPNQDSIKNRKVEIEVDQKNSVIDWSKVKLPIKTQFTLDDLSKELKFTYTLTVPRDLKDDKFLRVILHVKDTSGRELKDLSKTITIYIKPLIPDSLTSNRNYEFWFLTGTNFDLFNGVKAEEFFFRANALFKIQRSFFGQLAFYKNRYYTVDTTSGTLPFTTVKRPGSFNDSLYTLTAGNYERTTKQTVDPLGLQLDLLYKLTDDSVSNFFVTAGVDMSTTSVSIENNYKYSDTSFFLRTSKPDTVRGYNNFGTTSFPATINYKKSTYNLNFGFMWIMDESDVNIKAQLTAGISNYINLVDYYQSKGLGIVYNFQPKLSAYLQVRLFATYKPLGLSFGLESFIRNSEVPSFNFTLSKAFDIRGFIRNFTSVSGLKLKN